jgi:hypothetical protein
LYLKGGKSSRYYTIGLLGEVPLNGKSESRNQKSETPSLRHAASRMNGANRDKFKKPKAKWQTYLQGHGHAVPDD